MSGIGRLCKTPVSKQIWTANKSNLTFSKCRGDKCNYTDDSVSIQLNKYNSTGVDSNFQSSKRRKVSLDNAAQETYEEALSAEVYGFLSWLQNTTQQLSKVGTSLYHPDPYLRINRSLAERILHISKTDADRREKFLRRLLSEARDFITVAKKAFIVGQSGNSQFGKSRNKSDKTLYGKIFSPENGRDLEISFTEKHLCSIERHWELLRVQIKVLSIQLFESDLTEFDTAHFEGKKFEVLHKLSEKCKSVPDCTTIKNQSNYWQNPDELWPYRPQSIAQTSARSNYSSMSEDPWTNSDQSSSNLNVKNVELDSQLSPRDDGYHSNAGGSTIHDVCSIEESTSGSTDAGIDLAIKDLNSLNKELGILNNKDKNSKPGDVSSYYDVTSNKGASSRGEEWDKINEMVEEFSGNVLTLLSWIEEMTDILSCERDNKRTYFYNSNQDRLENASCHVTKLYEMVQLEASLLRERLPSESEVIGNIVKKVDLQYEQVYEPLRNKPALVRAPATAKPVDRNSRKATFPSENHIHVTSSPRDQKVGLVQTDGKHMEVAKKPSITAYKPTSYSTLKSTPVPWLKFVNNHNSLVDWIIRIHLLTDDVEVCYLAADQRRRLYEDYLFAVTAQKSKLERLAIESEILCQEFPDYSLDVYKKLSDVKRQWFKLEQRLRNKCRDFGDDFMPILKALEPASQFDIDQQISPRISRRQVAALGQGRVDIADHSFHQIRDKLGFDDRNKNYSSAPTKEWDAISPIYSSREPPRVAVSEGVSSVDGMNSFPNLTSTPNQKSLYKPFCPSMPEEIPIETEQETSTDHVSPSDQSEARKSSPLEDSAVECDRGEVTPTELANQISKFHSCLKEEECSSYSKQEVKSPGWCSEYLQKLQETNNNKKIFLERKNEELARLVALSNKQLTNENSTVDNDKLLWACVMLQQRCTNLILYLVDIEFVLDRRLDVLAKNCQLFDIVAHPLDEIWTDTGVVVDMFSDDDGEDYNILI